MSPLVKISEEVRTAVDEGRPVVALESTIIAHGLPRPENLQAAHDFEAILTDAGVVPATIAVIDGVPTVGLDADELERIALEDIPKVSSRDLAVAVGRKSSGATTVAATSTLAALAGIRVFATGGLGGVHRAAHESFDESADLVTLSRTRVTVVCAGVKSILDIAATLERLETLNVPVVGYRTNQFPAFYLTDSGFPLEWRVDSTEEVAAIMAAGDELGTRGALIVANPVPLDQQLDPDVHDRLLIQALHAADEAGLRGKAISPFLLDYFQRESGGRSLVVNLDLARNNVALAGGIAIAWSALPAAATLDESADRRRCHRRHRRHTAWQRHPRQRHDFAHPRDAWRFGGEPGSVACGVWREGSVRCAGRCGGRARHRLELSAFGVDAELIADHDAPTGTIVVMLDADGGRTMYTDRGANQRLSARRFAAVVAQPCRRIARQWVLTVRGGATRGCSFSDRRSTSPSDRRDGRPIVVRLSRRAWCVDVSVLHSRRCGVPAEPRRGPGVQWGRPNHAMCSPVFGCTIRWWR